MLTIVLIQGINTISTYSFILSILRRDVARNFLEGGSKYIEMSATMVGRQRKF